MFFAILFALVIILFLGSLFQKTGSEASMACSIVVPAFLAIAALPIISYWQFAQEITQCTTATEKFAIGTLSVFLALIATLSAKKAYQSLDEKAKQLQNKIRNAERQNGTREV